MSLAPFHMGGLHLVALRLGRHPNIHLHMVCQVIAIRGVTNLDEHLHNAQNIWWLVEID